MKRLAATAVAILLGVSAARGAELSAEQARQLFDDLYGSRLKQVQATPSKIDDIELAQELLADAAKPDHAPLVKVLCETAFDLGSAAPQGAPAAIEAMQLLGRKDPEAYEACSQKVLELRRKLYAGAGGTARREAAGPLITALCQWAAIKIDADQNAEAIAAYKEAIPLATMLHSRSLESMLHGMVSELHRTPEVGGKARPDPAAEQFKRLREQFKARPNDKALAQRLTDYCLIDLDDPKQAAQFVEPLDAGVRRMVGLAGSDQPLSPKEEYDVGSWYAGLTRRAPAKSQGRLAERARKHLKAYLNGADPKDLLRIKAQALLQQIDRTAKKPKQ